ncbi:MAG: hypothetical protein JO172_13310 [Hyphomicrobiales bacterium]|nr:hypothetical protein [Hyphomicrobiales bacterium]
MALAAITVMACGIAVLRNPNLPCDPLAGARWPKVDRHAAAMLFSAIVITACAVVLARQMAIAHREFAFTQMWILPDAASAERFTIGVQNFEKAADRYELEVRLDENVILRRSLALREGESWVSDLDVPIARDAAHKVEARLFMADDSQRVYRRVWIRTEPGA